MLFKESGCSWPNTLKFVPMTFTSNSSASVYRPWSEYMHARVAMLFNVSGYSGLRKSAST